MKKITLRNHDSIAGWLLFVIAFTVYTLTAEPGLSYWDCGEYISTAAKLQIGHPPGAPLFQMAGAAFAAFAPSPQSVAFAVNMVSVASSSLTIMFMFWTLVILLRTISGQTTASTTIRISSFTASLAFLFSDSFWFNATEAEVYAMASFFISVMLWAALKWQQQNDNPRRNRWLLLIALMTGLSFGVHFMALLTIPAIGLIYYFNNREKVSVKSFLLANVLVTALLLAIFLILPPLLLKFFAKTEIFSVNTLGLPFNSGTVIAGLLLVGAIGYALLLTRKRNMPAANTAILCLTLIITGFSCWMLLPVRAASHITVNEGNPDDAADLLAYYNREQYPEQKLLYGPLYTSAYAGLDAENPYTDSKPDYERNYATGRYEIINDYKNARQNPDSRQSGLLPRMHSEKHAPNYMAYTDPPKFTINPAYDFAAELPRYGIDPETISQEQVEAAAGQLRAELEKIIGDFRASNAKGEVDNTGYDRFLKSYGRYLVIEKPTFGQNLSFMANYQFGYMYWRYLMWNFAGRQSDIQGKGDLINGNWMSGINAIDSARLGSQSTLTTDMLSNKGRNMYYMIPFLFGLLGMFVHARRDWKSFYALLTLFLFTGIALKVFLNESPFEVRERDYALVGSFYVFALWIGFGLCAALNAVAKLRFSRVALPASALACLAAIPLLMATQNWDDHDRSGRYTAVAKAKAFLDSCEPNAILFTQADNDTFPLWYTQEIENYRTDVRVVCSTYLTADWYIDQMKRQAYDSMPLPISFKRDDYKGDHHDYVLYNPATDARIGVDDFLSFVKSDDERAKITMENGHSVNYYPTAKLRLPVDRDTIIRTETVAKAQHKDIVPYIDIDLPDNAIYKNNLIMLDIIANNKWKRPVYFAGGSTENEDYLWMKDYLRLDGMVYRLVPVKTTMSEDASPLDIGYIDSGKMLDTVKKWQWGNSGNPHVYIDPETRHTGSLFRHNMARLSDTLIAEGKTKQAAEVIGIAMKNMPLDTYGLYFTLEPFADGYYKVNNKKAARNLAAKIIRKYREQLAYYHSLDKGLQKSYATEIMTNIERYRNILLIIKENRDLAYYQQQKNDFNRHNKMFGSLGLPNE